MNIIVERAVFSVVGVSINGSTHEQMGWRDEAEKYMYRQWGWITVFSNLKLTCKICDETHMGFEATNHVQLKIHAEAKRKLIGMIENDNGPDHEDYCEGCIALMREDNPYEDTSENVCQLGYCYQEEDIDGQTKIVYNLGQDLFRPDSCVTIFGR